MNTKAAGCRLITLISIASKLGKQLFGSDSMIIFSAKVLRLWNGQIGFRT